VSEPPIRIRPARDDDGPALIVLIERIWDEYPGCVMDVDGEVPELRRIASAHAEGGGAFWIAELEGDLVGCVGWVPRADGAGVELRKLYVAARARRRGLGACLCERVESAARDRAYVDLWSDTRFEDAHRLYEARGYLRGPHTRELHDRSHTVEYYYHLSL